VWALDQLAASVAIDLARDYDELVEGLDAGLVREPDEAGRRDDGFLAGRCGALALAQRHRDDPARADLLVRLIAEQAEHSPLDLLYGAPGTMVLAAAEQARTAIRGTRFCRQRVRPSPRARPRSSRPPDDRVRRRRDGHAARGRRGRPGQLAGARRLAMHALGHVERRVTPPWHSLFTGDVGVALCLRSCVEADPRFPALGWF
jgi:hypothetical protein